MRFEKSPKGIEEPASEMGEMVDLDKKKKNRLTDGS